MRLPEGVRTCNHDASVVMTLQDGSHWRRFVHRRPIGESPLPMQRLQVGVGTWGMKINQWGRVGAGDWDHILHTGCMHE